MYINRRLANLAFIFSLLFGCAAMEPVSEGICYLNVRPTLKESRQYPLICWSETRTEPLRIHYLKFDLHSSVYEMAVLPSRDVDGEGSAEGSLEKPEVLLMRHSAVVAINANAFQNPKDKKAHKWVLGMPVDMCGFVGTQDGQVSPPEDSRAAFWIDSDNRPHIGQLDTDADVIGVADWNHANKSRNAILLKGGELVAPRGGGRHPRTAIGFDESGRWITMVVVDGRRKNYSRGVTLVELAEILRDSGCSDAINLDGGGSSIMLVAEGDSIKTINRPSGNSHRPIPVMIGVRKKRTFLDEIVPTEGLVGHWSLDENSGDTVVDSSEAKRDGSVVGGLSLGQSSCHGVIGRALTFDGTGGGISFEQVEIEKNITVCAWAKLNAITHLDSGHVVSNHPGWYLSGVNKKMMRFGLQSENREISIGYGAPEELGAGWHHFVGTYDGRFAKTYLDGVLVGVAPFNEELKKGGESRIGRYWKKLASGTKKYNWRGLIDDVRIYNRALSALEVRALYEHKE